MPSDAWHLQFLPARALRVQTVSSFYRTCVKVVAYLAAKVIIRRESFMVVI